MMTERVSTPKGAMLMRRRARARRLREQIAELILAEPRRARNEINACDLPLFGALVGVEQQIGAVRTPRDRRAVRVGQEGELTARTAAQRNNMRILESSLPAGEVADPPAVRRPRDRPIR